MSETIVNTFAGSPLNRLSWLRPSHSFLNAIVVSPATRWILFNAGQPLVTVTAHDTRPKRVLAYLSTSDIKPLLGPEPFFGQGKNEGDLVPSPDSEGSNAESSLEAARHRGTPLVFLGLQELRLTGSALPSSDFKDPSAAVANLEGTPFFTMDVAGFQEEQVEEVLKRSGLSVGKGEELSWSEPRALMGSLDAFTAGVFAEARSMVDWNQRNKFCPGCGSPTYSMWGGWKLSCFSLLPWADNTGRQSCPTVKGLHNFTHPRTDPVVIMIAIDETNDKVLLGRSKKFPGKFYSALAGFIEPGESFEDAVSREMWEEAGVKVWNIRYHSGQPWPYPANLMVGFYARADASQPIRTDLDNELQDARWYTRSEILAVLNHTNGTYFSGRDHKQMAAAQEGRDNLHHNNGPNQGAGALAHSDPNIQAKTSVPSSSDMTTLVTNAPVEVIEEPPFKLPPMTAIAGVLIRDWAVGEIGFGDGFESQGLSLKKGSL